MSDAIKALLGEQGTPPKSKGKGGASRDNYRRAVREFMAAAKSGDEDAAVNALDAVLMEHSMGADD